MNHASRIDRIEDLFIRALELPAAARESFLRAECGDSEDILEEVRSLLAHEAGGDDVAKAEVLPGWLQTSPPRLDRGEPAVAAAWAQASEELLQGLHENAAAFRRYRIAQELGRGGMGVVKKAFDPHLQRDLAIKIMHGDEESGSSASSPLSIGRFLEEAQITSQLSHPGIVPVHELGVDSEGRLYFTMQLVRGMTFRNVIEWVWSGREGWNQTRAINVLRDVCNALAYAHSKGVVHRDVKPSNIMVGRYGETFLMDWGIARVIGQPDRNDLRLRELHTITQIRTERKKTDASATDTPLVTMDGLVVGTPAYMSPEQAEGRIEEVDARADVYSVGVLLYQLLTQQMPYVTPGAQVSPRTVLAQLLLGPPRPVTACNPAAVPELVAICEKAMARDRTERYPSTRELGDDLRAFLEERVVQAYRTGAVVELKKWVQRNRKLAAAAAAAVLLVSVSALAFFVQKQALARTNRELTESRAQLTASNEALQSTADLLGAAQQNLTAQNQELKATAAELYAAQADLGSRHAELERTAEDLRAAQDELTARNDNLTHLVESFEQLLVSTDPYQKGRTDITVVELLDQQLEQILEGLDHSPLLRADFLSTAGDTYDSLGRAKEAERFHREALELRLQHLPADDPAIDASRSDLAASLRDLGRSDEAEALWTEILSRSEDPEDRTYLRRKRSLAKAIAEQGRVREAETMLLDVHATQVRRFGVDDRDASVTLGSLASLYLDQERNAEAVTVLREALDFETRHIGPQDRSTSATRHNLAVALARTDHPDEAIELMRQALDDARSVFGPGHGQTLSSQEGLADLLREAERYPEAEQVRRDLWKIRATRDGESSAAALREAEYVVVLLLEQQQDAAAEALVAELIATAAEAHGTESEILLRLKYFHAQAIDGQGRTEEAAQLYERILRSQQKVLPPDNQDITDTQWRLALVLVELKQREAAVELLRQTTVSYSKSHGPSAVRTLKSIYWAAGSLHSLGRDLEAVQTTCDGLARINALAGSPYESRFLEDLDDSLPDLEDSLVDRALQSDPEADDTRELLESVHLAQVWRGRGRDVEEAMFAALQRAVSRDGEVSESAGRMRLHYGMCLASLDEFESAETELLAAHSILEEAVGAAHPQTQHAVRALIRLYVRQDQREEARDWQDELRR